MEVSSVKIQEPSPQIYVEHYYWLIAFIRIMTCKSVVKLFDIFKDKYSVDHYMRQTI